MLCSIHLKEIQVGKSIEAYTLTDWLEEEEEFIRIVLHGIRKQVPAWREGKIPTYKSRWQFFSGYVKGVMLRMVGFDGNPMTQEELSGLGMMLEEVKSDEVHRDHRREVAG